MSNENPGIDFKSVYAKSWGDTSEEQETTIQKLIEAKHPSNCGCFDDAGPDLGVDTFEDDVTEAIEQGCDGGQEERIRAAEAAFEEEIIKASEMAQRALDRAEQALIKAEDQAVIGDGNTASLLVAIHDRWLHFAEVVAP